MGSATKRAALVVGVHMTFYAESIHNVGWLLSGVRLQWFTDCQVLVPTIFPD